MDEYADLLDAYHGDIPEAVWQEVLFSLAGGGHDCGEGPTADPEEACLVQTEEERTSFWWADLVLYPALESGTPVLPEPQLTVAMSEEAPRTLVPPAAADNSFLSDLLWWLCAGILMVLAGRAGCMAMAGAGGCPVWLPGKGTVRPRAQMRTKSRRR